jgi:hypothetical protein
MALSDPSLALSDPSLALSDPPLALNNPQDPALAPHSNRKQHSVKVDPQVFQRVTNNGSHSFNEGLKRFIETYDMLQGKKQLL